ADLRAPPPRRRHARRLPQSCHVAARPRRREPGRPRAPRAPGAGAARGGPPRRRGGREGGGRAPRRARVEPPEDRGAGLREGARGIAGLPDEEQSAVKDRIEKTKDPAPRELSEGYALLAARSVESGRYGEAIDRYKKSLQLDVNTAASKVGEARVYVAWHRAV